jgi:hypothetical protein
MNIFQWLVYFNDIVSQSITPYLIQDGIVGFFAQFPIYILLGFFIIAGGFALFMDFIKDSWKVPFGIIADIIDVMAMQFPGIMDIAAAIYGVFIYSIFARKNRFFMRIFIVATFIEAIIGIGFPLPIVGDIGYITNVFPLNTFMMILVTVVD